MPNNNIDSIINVVTSEDNRPYMKINKGFSYFPERLVLYENEYEIQEIGMEMYNYV